MSNHPNRTIAAARRFARNAGRKSAKRKAVAKLVRDYDAGLITHDQIVDGLRATQPWQAHGPINP